MWPHDSADSLARRAGRVFGSTIAIAAALGGLVLASELGRLLARLFFL